MSKTALELIRRDFLLRRSRNPAYSMRAYARMLGLPSGRLSELLSGKRGLTQHSWTKIGQRVRHNQSESFQIEKELRDSMLAAKPDPYTLIDSQDDQDVYRLVSDRLHYALLSLINLTGFRNEPRWIAQKLSTSIIEVTNVIDRLKRLGLVVEKRGKLIRKYPKIKTTDGSTSNAIRESHKASLEAAKTALEDLPTTERNISSVSFAFDSRRLQEAGEIIKMFRRKFSAKMERGNSDQVYELTISLVPLSRRIE